MARLHRLLHLALSLSVLLPAIANTSARAQYLPPNPGMCGSGFIYSARMCVPRDGRGNAYAPPMPGACASGYIYSARMCVPRQGGAVNAYQPPMPGACATGFVYSAGMCVPRR